MKKIAATILIFALALCLASCEVGVKETWFSCELLESYGIAALPIPCDSLNNTVLVESVTDDGRYSGTFYFTSTNTNINEYAHTVANFLVSNAEIFNVGEREGHGGLIAEILPYDDYRLVSEGISYDQDSYTFAYSLAQSLVMGSGYVPSLDDPVKITIATVDEEELYRGFTYNAKIEIKQSSWPACAIIGAKA